MTASQQNVKKPKKTEVNYYSSNPAGDTDESLEKLRLELLNDVRQRNSSQCVREKISRMFSCRRKKVAQGSPSAGEVKARWPALFFAAEEGACS